VQAAEERDAAAKLGEAASEAKAAATAAEKEAAGLKREQQGTAKAALVAERKAQKQRDLLEEQAPLRVKNTEEGARAVKRLKRLEVALANAQKARGPLRSGFLEIGAKLVVPEHLERTSQRQPPPSRATRRGRVCVYRIPLSRSPPDTLTSTSQADAERTKTLAKLDADLADLQAAQATYDASRRQQAAASGERVE
jgi:hypothetical protein